MEQFFWNVVMWGVIGWAAWKCFARPRRANGLEPAVAAELAKSARSARDEATGEALFQQSQRHLLYHVYATASWLCLGPLLLVLQCIFDGVPVAQNCLNFLFWTWVLLLFSLPAWLCRSVRFITERGRRPQGTSRSVDLAAQIVTDYAHRVESS